ncbi:MAG: DUF1194 domain-containing protein [Maritimibacter sp.]
MNRGLAAAVLAALLFFASKAQAQEAPCRQALALGLDVSGSVDAREYRMQLDGLAAALVDDEVRAALLQGATAPVSLFVFEWSDAADQRVLIPWTALIDQATLETVSARLRALRRAPAGVSTALGAAMATGAHELAKMDHCWQRTLDISADGMSNTGPRPQDIAALPALTGLTLNALVILPDGQSSASPQASKLTTYFEQLVIRGAGAFVQEARGYGDYGRAMKRKLLREIGTITIGALPHGDPLAALARLQATSNPQ